MVISVVAVIGVYGSPAKLVGAEGGCGQIPGPTPCQRCSCTSPYQPKRIPVPVSVSNGKQQPEKRR